MAGAVCIPKPVLCTKKSGTHISAPRAGSRSAAELRSLAHLAPQPPPATYNFLKALDRKSDVNFLGCSVTRGAWRSVMRAEPDATLRFAPEIEIAADIRDKRLRRWRRHGELDPCHRSPVGYDSGRRRAARSRYAISPCAGRIYHNGGSQRCNCIFDNPAQR